MVLKIPIITNAEAKSFGKKVIPNSHHIARGKADRASFGQRIRNTDLQFAVCGILLPL